MSWPLATTPQPPQVPKRAISHSNGRNQESFVKRRQRGSISHTQKNLACANSGSPHLCLP
jgi:hypothetical protein